MCWFWSVYALEMASHRFPRQYGGIFLNTVLTYVFVQIFSALGFSSCLSRGIGGLDTFVEILAAGS